MNELGTNEEKSVKCERCFDLVSLNTISLNSYMNHVYPLFVNFVNIFNFKCCSLSYSINLFLSYSFPT